MKKDTLEHLSSLMDGELTQETSLFVARRLGADRELGATWERYHLIRECLRRPGGRWSASGLSVDFEGSQSAEAPVEPSAPRSRGWLKPAAGFAIAASVAMLAVLGVVPDQAPEVTAPTAANQPFVSPNNANISPMSQAASFQNGVASERLNAYLLRHNQVAGSVGRQGFVALVPIVTTTPVQVLDPPADVGEETDPTDGTVDATRP